MNDLDDLLNDLSRGSVSVKQPSGAKKARPGSLRVESRAAARQRAPRAARRIAASSFVDLNDLDSLMADLGASNKSSAGSRVRSGGQARARVRGAGVRRASARRQRTRLWPRPAERAAKEGADGVAVRQNADARRRGAAAAARLDARLWPRRPRRRAADQGEPGRVAVRQDAAAAAAAAAAATAAAK